MNGNSEHEPIKLIMVKYITNMLIGVRSFLSLMKAQRIVILAIKLDMNNAIQ